MLEERIETLSNQLNELGKVQLSLISAITKLHHSLAPVQSVQVSPEKTKPVAKQADPVDDFIEPPVDHEIEQAVEKGVTIDQLVTIIKALDDDGRKGVKVLLNTFGAQKLPDLKTSDYPSFHKAILTIANRTKKAA